MSFKFESLLGVKLYGEAKGDDEVPMDEVIDGAPSGKPEVIDQEDTGNEEEIPSDKVPEDNTTEPLSPDNDGEDVEAQVDDNVADEPTDGEEEDDSLKPVDDSDAFAFTDTDGLDEATLAKRSKQVTKWLNNNLTTYKQLMLDIDNADMYPEKRDILQPIIDQYKEVISLYDTYMKGIESEDELSKIEKSLEFRALFIALNEQLSRALIELSESEGR